ncbi:MAG: hypothetical protein QM763_03100 [Agriterribacter sp.]
MPFCQKLTTYLKKWFKKVDTFLLDNTETAVQIVGKFKYYINNPVADLLMQIIPGELDDTILFSVRKAVDLSLDKLMLLSGCTHDVDLESKLLCYSRFLRNLPKDIRDAQLFKFASLLAKQLDGGRFSQSDYDMITQSVYVSDVS